MHLLLEVLTAMNHSNGKLVRTRSDRMYNNVRKVSNWCGCRNSTSLLTTLQIRRWVRLPSPDASSFQRSAAKWLHGSQSSPSILELVEPEGSLLETQVLLTGWALLLRHSR